MRKVVLLVLCMVLVVVPLASAAHSTQKLEVQKHLRKLNKPPVKSIKSPDGDIIDCIHISHQPAFDHPNLKNHKIQMRPSMYPEGHTPFEESKVSSNSKPISQLWHQNGRCSEGTIPIRRTKKDDIMRASSVQQFGKKNQRSFPQPKPAKLLLDSSSGYQHAIAYVEGDKYYGTKATMNVWNPKVQQPDEFSLAQLWILGGPFDRYINSIEAGWQVSSHLYGDNNTRFFIYWTNDSYQHTGCYNLRCSGFIQISNNITLGASISPLSQYGSSQYDITILVWKDPKKGSWWLKYGKDNIVGYWPASLFSHLSVSASRIEWGGEVRRPTHLNADGEWPFR